MKKEEIAALLGALSVSVPFGAAVVVGGLLGVLAYKGLSKKGMKVDRNYIKNFIKELKEAVKDTETKNNLTEVTNALGLATKQDIENKVSGLATKQDLNGLAKKEDLKELQKEIGKVGNKLGELSESFVAPSIDVHIRNELVKNNQGYNIFVKNRIIVAEPGILNSNTGKMDPGKPYTDLDFLVVAKNQNASKIIIVEVKTSFWLSDVKHFVDKVKGIYNNNPNNLLFYAKYSNYLKSNKGKNFQGIVSFIGRGKVDVATSEKEIWFVFLIGDVDKKLLSAQKSGSKQDGELYSLQQDLLNNHGITLRLFRLKKDKSDLEEIEIS